MPGRNDGVQTGRRNAHNRHCERSEAIQPFRRALLMKGSRPAGTTAYKTVASSESLRPGRRHELRGPLLARRLDCFPPGLTRGLLAKTAEASLSNAVRESAIRLGSARNGAHNRHCERSEAIQPFRRAVLMKGSRPAGTTAYKPVASSESLRPGRRHELRGPLLARRLDCFPPGLTRGLLAMTAEASLSNAVRESAIRLGIGAHNRHCERSEAIQPFRRAVLMKGSRPAGTTAYKPVASSESLRP